MRLYPVIYKGEVIEGYYVTRCGKFYGKRGHQLSVNYPYPDNTNPYPKVTVGGKSITCHTLMAHTFIPFPEPENRPEGFDALPDEWKNYILEAEKRYNIELQVDHINLDKDDWSIENLRWVTASKNQQHYQDHKRKQKEFGVNMNARQESYSSLVHLMS